MSKFIDYKASYALTNTSDRWLLLGDSHVLVSDHETKEEAETAAAQIEDIGEELYSVLTIIPPGGESKSELRGTVETTGGEESESIIDSWFSKK